MDAKLALIVAYSKNRVIGKDGKMPWHLSEDLKFFKRTTMDKPIIMGRKTFQSIGKALPGRTNIVVTRDASFEAEDVIVVPSLDEARHVAVDIAHMQGADEIMVIGGAEIYGQTLPFADRLYVTEIDAEIEGDAFFPVPEGKWAESERSKPILDEKSGYKFTFVTLDRAQ